MSEETHRLVVDRFEGDLVVVEVDGERFLDLPRWLLPDDVREDDVLVVGRCMHADGTLTLEVRVDPEAAERTRAEVRAVVERLRHRDPGGDLTL